MANGSITIFESCFSIFGTDAVSITNFESCFSIFGTDAVSTCQRDSTFLLISTFNCSSKTFITDKSLLFFISSNISTSLWHRSNIFFSVCDSFYLLVNSVNLNTQVCVPVFSFDFYSSGASLIVFSLVKPNLLFWSYMIHATALVGNA